MTDRNVASLPTIQQLIRAKRDGLVLGEPEIRAFIRGVVDGSVADYQATAMLMAIFFRGLDDAELAVWTDAMLNSGRVLDLRHLGRPRVDKHSTGGVGDKVSIALAPLVAACGAAVPMVSGRGLGHTGGTLDKLEAIPGFNTRLDAERLVQVLERCGLALVGQTDDLAPADRRLYALRDVSGTVESIPLIASSIMSKKLAEGLDALVFDVKVGSGAFMKELEQARRLARTLVAIGAPRGVAVSALLTDMSQPLGRAVGNALETREAIELLTGGGPEDLWQLTRELGAEMLLAARLVASRAQGRDELARARADGRGLERLRQCVALQEGDPRVVDQPDRLPLASSQRTILAARSGFVGAIATEQIGMAALLLGAGRQRVDDAIDHAAGIVMHARLGQAVRASDELATLHFNDPARYERAAALVARAIEITDAPVSAPPLVHEVIACA